jgi:hypothetical protein
MRFHIEKLCGLTFAASLSITAHAQADCTNGTPDATQCINLLKKAETQLQNTTSLYGKTNSEKLRKTYDVAYAHDFQKKLRVNVIQWQAYRNSQCSMDVLGSGMTLQYVPAIVASCQLGMTVERLEDFKQKLKYLND